MSEHRRTASLVVSLLIGLALIGLVLYAVPHTSAIPKAGSFIGTGSTSITQLTPQPTDAADHHDGEPSTSALPVGDGAGQQAAGDNRPHRSEGVRDGSRLEWTEVPVGPQEGRGFDVRVGDVGGLAPGVDTPLPVTFVNPMHTPLTVRSATVSATGTPACPADSLRLATVDFAEPVQVPARSAVRGRLPFGLLRSAGDGCQGASFAVTVDATATTR